MTRRPPQPPDVIHTPRPIDRAYQFTMCRGVGHAWFEVPTDWIPLLGVGFTLRCERCGCERRDTLHRDWGTVVSRNYIYPEGYSYAGEDEQPKRIDFLLELVSPARRRR